MDNLPQVSPTELKEQDKDSLTLEKLKRAFEFLEVQEEKFKDDLNNL